MHRAELLALRDAELARRKQAGDEMGAALAALDPRTTFPSFIRDAVADRLDRRALIDGERVYPYRQLFAAIDAAAIVLEHSGVRPGEAVALLIDNSDRYAVWYFAVLQLGAVAIPINTKLVEREIAHIVGDAGARLAVVDDGYLALMQGIAQAQAKPFGVMGSVLPPAGLTCGSPAAPPAGVLDRPAAVYYTSGTTGMPKGVVHTHRTVIAGCLQAPFAWQFPARDFVSLAVTPLFHIAAHTLFFPVFHSGGTLIIATFKPAEVFELIEGHRVTSFFGVPSILLIMAQRARELGVTFPGVQVVQFGAAPMPMEKLGEVQALFPKAALLHGMGQTESCGTLVTLPGSLALAKIGSVGLPLPATDIAIFDERDRPVAADVVGELVGRSPSVMAGYLNRPDATAETMKSGWLHTGDLGYLDDDGFLFLVDRKKDMIIRGGQNIYSNEVEQVLAGHPALAEVAVIGMPSPILGEEVCAFVVAKPDQPTDAAQVQEFCRPLLAGYKIPVAVHFIEALPRNATGKVLKPSLRKMLSDPAGQRG
jgi:acyl-CoA synthetase (AMP-forming)/AMP-acid ligase II